MVQQGDAEMITKVIAAKSSLDKWRDFANHSRKRAARLNPFRRMHAVRLVAEAQSLIAHSDTGTRSTASRAAYILGRHPTKHLFCSHCGVPMQAGARSCNACGALQRAK